MNKYTQYTHIWVLINHDVPVNHEYDTHNPNFWDLKASPAETLWLIVTTPPYPDSSLLPHRSDTLGFVLRQSWAPTISLATGCYGHTLSDPPLTSDRPFWSCRSHWSHLRISGPVGCPRTPTYLRNHRATRYQTYLRYLRAKEGLQVYAHKTLLQDLRLGLNFVVGQIWGYRSDGGAKTSLVWWNCYN